MAYIEGPSSINAANGNYRKHGRGGKNRTNPCRARATLLV
jgi:hypothetical protein